MIAATLTIAAICPCWLWRESDEEAIRSTVDEFYAAIVNGNGDKACDLLAPEVRKEFGSETLDVSCRDVITRMSGWDGAPEIRTVAVDGEQATVRLEQGNKFGTIRLSQDDGWHVVDF